MALLGAAAFGIVLIWPAMAVRYQVAGALDALCGPGGAPGWWPG
ncbi:hypothetical protein RCO28_39015 [Streptomyces sp. LHD-70]|nr:hypothetical protein [Streptomyces sp. LHD-70]MDQ8708405.1 hypothetical protein [Streptomyces sp. LHD-70]